MSTETALALVEEAPAPQSLSMIDGPDPAAAMEYAQTVSTAIASVLKPGNGYIEMRGRKHVEAAGWQTIAAMTGHTCEIEWSRPIDGMDHKSGFRTWESRAVVRDQSGRIVSTGESMASPAEGAPWARADFSIRSMSQTRAMGRALSARMRYVVQLAGFQGAPAEEMGDVEREQEAIKTARNRWGVLKEECETDNETLTTLVGPNPKLLVDDDFFATMAFKLGWKAAMEQSNPPEEAAVDGEVVENSDEALADKLFAETAEQTGSAPGDA